MIPQRSTVKIKMASCNCSRLSVAGFWVFFAGALVVGALFVSAVFDGPAFDEIAIVCD
jgi:hypothetical protein